MDVIQNNIGKVVKIVDPGNTYAMYVPLAKKINIRGFVPGLTPKKNEIGVILDQTKHLQGGEEIFVIRIFRTNLTYLMSIRGFEDINEISFLSIYRDEQYLMVQSIVKDIIKDFHKIEKVNRLFDITKETDSFSSGGIDININYSDSLIKIEYKETNRRFYSYSDFIYWYRAQLLSGKNWNLELKQHVKK